MIEADLLLLALGGLAGGFLVGLVGVGGGIVYAPVLLIFYTRAGVVDPVLTPLVLGTSLFCVGFAAASGALAQYRAGMVNVRMALITGGAAALVVTATGQFVTTQPWYDRQTFGIVFGLMLLGIALQMWFEHRAEAQAQPARAGSGPLVFAGIGAGLLSASAGVGGGVVLVPIYRNLFTLPTKSAVGTSAAAIVLISLMGAATYTVLGLGAPVPPGAVGFVDPLRGAILALPAMLTARLGVRAGHRLPSRVVRRAFAAVALAVSVQLLWSSLV
jgi:uncharacterized protein